MKLGIILIVWAIICLVGSVALIWATIHFVSKFW